MAFLCFFAFLAGAIDAAVGGGGLIQLPALFNFLPPQLSAAVPVVFGTNKLSSICGTSTAAWQYARRVSVPWFTIAPAALAAFAFSGLGARCVQVVNAEFLKPLVLVLLVLVAVYTYARKDMGTVHAPRFVRAHERVAGVLAGMVIGFYDGFFGPGTGSFLIFVFVGIFRFDFLTASASAKCINFATNCAAVIAFGLAGQILWRYAVPMGVCNVAGAVVGTQIAVLKGNQFVRRLFLVVVSALTARFAWLLARGH